MITAKEFLMGRDKEYPLTPLLEGNMLVTLEMVNKLEVLIGQDLKCSSGYRPGRYNKAAGGSLKSSHLTCEAIDISDPSGDLNRYISENEEILIQIGAYREDPSRTKTWVHLQTRRPPSGNRTFKV